MPQISEPCATVVLAAVAARWAAAARPCHRVRGAAGARGRARANDLDVSDSREMSVAELPGRARARADDAATDERKEDLAESILKAEQTERAGPTTRWASSTSSTRATASCAALPSSEDVYVPRARSDGSACASAIGFPVPSGPARAGEVLGPPAGRQRQRRRHRDRPRPAGLQRPHAGPPRRADQPRERSEEPQPADDQPGRSHRQQRALIVSPVRRQDDASRPWPTGSPRTTRTSS